MLQALNSLSGVSGRCQVDARLPIVTPVSHTHPVCFVQVLQGKPKRVGLAGKQSRALRFPTLHPTLHNEPQRERTGLQTSVERAD